MSTPAYKKAARLAQQAEEKRQREYEKLFARLTAPRGKVEKKTSRSFEPYKPAAEPYRRETPKYPSLNPASFGPCTLPERKVYTGTLIKGIATMHKSNAVPVINDEQAKEISQMRRN